MPEILAESGVLAVAGRPWQPAGNWVGWGHGDRRDRRDRRDRGGCGGSGKGKGGSGNGPPGTQCHPPAQGRQRLGFDSRCPLAMARLPALPTLDAADLVGVGSRKGVASPLYLVRSFNRIAPNSPMHG